jgi:hypothetical protein
MRDRSPGHLDELIADNGILVDRDESAQSCADTLHDAEVVEHQEVGSGSVPDGGKEPVGERLRRKRIDAQAPAAAGDLAREQRRHVRMGVSPVCGEPTFQMRIVVPFCACGVTRSSVANTVHAKVRYMLAC